MPGRLLMTAGKAADLREGTGLALDALLSRRAGRGARRLCRGEQWLTCWRGSSRASGREVAARLSGPVAAEPTQRSLRAALARPGARFIMEVKRASPSGHRSAVSVEEAVAAYAPVADAISVLTDGADFGGSLDDLALVRARFDGPILAKDFIVDPAQVSEARAHGADAVLVMMSVLDDAIAAAVLGRGEAARHGRDRRGA